MPYMIVKQKDSGKECVYKHDSDGNPVGDSHGCHDTHDKAVAQMRALYAAERDSMHKSLAEISAALETFDVETLVKMSLDVSDKAETYGGTERSKLKDSDFVFSDERKFPVMTAQDVKDAVSSWGRYKGSHSFDEFKRRLTALAKRKKLESALPEKWSSEKADLGSLLAIGVKALYDAAKSDTVWAGVSHNAWEDDIKDIIPLPLIEDDIVFQKRLMEKGLAVQFGEGLWLDHQKGHVIGDCLLREVVDGGRYCFEMGNLKPGQERLNGLQMSIGYNYRLKAANDYEFVYVFERSALEKSRRINGRTFFSVKRRAALSDAALVNMADELSAMLEA